MYEEYYGFDQPPFNLTPDPRFLYRSESHDDALQQVSQAIGRKEGFVVLTGDIGTGKTTVCRALIEQFDQTIFAALMLSPFLSVEELLREVLLGFGVASRDALKTGRLATATKHELIRTLHDFLLSLVPLRGSAVLLIDEAQHLSTGVLEEIRVLSNLETNEQKLLQIVMVGQLNLLEVLQKDELRQLDQRISIRCALKALTREEVEAYVTHRLWVARGSTAVSFTPKAFDQVHAVSGGVPRIINLICDRSLMAGCDAQTQQITEEHVAQAIRRLGLEPGKGQVRDDRKALGAGAWRRFLRPALLAVAVLAAAIVGAAIYRLGNPIEVFRPGPPPLARPAPRGPQAAPLAVLPVLAELPAPVVPPWQAGPFSVLIGTYDSARQVAVVEAQLMAHGLPTYTIDLSFGPGDIRRRVLVGRYPTRDEAEGVRQHLGAPMADARVIAGELERLRTIP